MSAKYDIAVIGGGPGGYVAAIRAAQLGKKVVCIEKRGSLGGTCLNVGCIPSKALLHSSEKYEEVTESFAEHGIKVEKFKLDLKAMMARKDKVVSDLCNGIEFLFKKNKVDYVKGSAKFKDKQTLEVTVGKKKEIITADRIIIATGSEVTDVPGIKIDEKQIVSSTGALELSKVPKTMIVIGGGYIGLELGSVWRRLGAKVTVVEYMDRITPNMDKELGSTLMKILQKQGVEFKLGTKVMSAKTSDKGVILEIEPAAGGKKEKLNADVVLVSVGRKPYTEGLGLEAAGVELNDRGQIVTDKHFQTNIDSVFAIGDVTEGPMLAHKAEEEGVAVAEHLTGKYGHVNYGIIPSVAYTWPEVASVGASEEELKNAGIAYKVGKFPFMANSRARAVGETDGFVKILADKEKDRVLGVHIIGPDAGTLIAQAAAVMEFGASSEDIARTCHAHPTLNEAVKEAALAVDKRALHA